VFDDAVGIVLNESENNTISNNFSFGHHSLTIYSTGININNSSNNNTIFNNTCNYNRGPGIAIKRTNDLKIINNTCNDNIIGIYSDNSEEQPSENMTLVNNTCAYNSWSGIYLLHVLKGILTNNTCFNNTDYGAHLYHCINVSVVWNVFDRNVYDNALDEPSGENDFDYNYWSDYTGIDENGDGIGDTPYNDTGVYVFDEHPLMYPIGSAPLLNSPDDIQYEEGTMGHNIIWSHSILNPDSFKVYRDGSLFDSEFEWDGTPLTVSVDGLSIGSYNYTLIIFDINENSADDTVFVSVVMPIAPTINSPDDIQYESGTIGNSISWTPSDQNPESYEVLRNDTQIHNGTWDGTAIEVSIDGLALGVYNFTLVVVDSLDISARDIVMVVVIDTTEPILNTPEDIQFKVGAIGHNITWELEDENPFTYEIFMNVTLLTSGAWNSSGEFISFNLDNLSVGIFLITLYVTDLAGHTASDMVIVTVFPDSSTTTTETTPTDTTNTNDTTPTFDVQLMTIIGLGVGSGVILIVIIIVFQKKRM